ncbi:MAG: RES family NAD+ phosphorylase [Terracidiphilus sp.]|jgi:RES domain-containing protein
MQVWRVFPQRFRETAFTGAGCLYVDGRWNHMGTAMVYTATSRALAALEYFVNLDPGESPGELFMAQATVPDKLIETFDDPQLPANWRELDNLRCRDLGSSWANSRRSLALHVPSVVVDGDTNLLINPAHADFSKVAVAEAIPFHFDPRMFR